MKQKLIVLCALLLAVVACDPESNVDPIGEWELTGASLTSPDAGASLALNTAAPNSVLRFEWSAASNTEGYAHTYEVLLDSADGDFDTPIWSATPASNDLFVEVTHLEVDQALATLGIAAGATAELSWAVRTTALSKSDLASAAISITRFAEETVPDALYLAGTATEVGDDPANGIAMVALTDADGASTQIFEAYTSLTDGESFRFYTSQSSTSQSFGGNSGALVNGGDAVVVGEAGTYRVRVDFNSESYELFKIDRWSVVGNVIENGWGGDAALAYQGGGIWEAVINMVDADPGDASKRFIFRANGDWGHLLKQVVGSEGVLISEAFANDNGYTVEDVPLMDPIAKYKVTLDLSGPTYTYALAVDNTPPADAPEALFLLGDGQVVAELTKDADVFRYQFIDLDPAVSYTLNTASDGSGTGYTLASSVGENGEGSDKVTGSGDLLTGSTALGVAEQQAYSLTVDFGSSAISWAYYNFKLFHWSDWDTRQELTMSYQGDYTWTLTETLTAGHESKFISPWDYDFGSDSPSESTGTMTAGGGANFTNITEDGSYTVSITLEPDFATGTYEFMKQ